MSRGLGHCMRRPDMVPWRRHSRGFFAALFLILSLLVEGSQDMVLSPEKEFEQKMVKILGPIVVDVLTRLDNRKSMLTPEACGCSYHVCGEEFPDMECLKTRTPLNLSCGEYPLCGYMQVGATLILRPKHRQQKRVLLGSTVRVVCLKCGNSSGGNLNEKVGWARRRQENWLELMSLKGKGQVGGPLSSTANFRVPCGGKNTHPDVNGVHLFDSELTEES